MKNKILVIDDDQELTYLLKAQLERKNHHVEVAHSGVEGLQSAYRAHPDLVILDIMMPQMDGYETLERIRQVSSVPVIMLTVKAEEEDKVRGLELGADDYVTKPFSPRELMSRVTNDTETISLFFENAVAQIIRQDVYNIRLRR